MKSSFSYKSDIIRININTKLVKKNNDTQGCEIFMEISYCCMVHFLYGTWGIYEIVLNFTLHALYPI